MFNVFSFIGGLLTALIVAVICMISLYISNM